MPNISYSTKTDDGRYIAEDEDAAEVFRAFGSPFVMRSELEAKEQIAREAQREEKGRLERERIAAAALARANAKIKSEPSLTPEERAERRERRERLAATKKEIAALESEMAEMKSKIDAREKALPALWDQYDGALNDRWRAWYEGAKAKDAGDYNAEREHRAKAAEHDKRITEIRRELLAHGADLKEIGERHHTVHTKYASDYGCI